MLIDIFLIQFDVDYFIIIALSHLHAELHMITDLLCELRFCPVHCLDEPVKKPETSQRLSGRPC